MSDELTQAIEQAIADKKAADQARGLVTDQQAVVKQASDQLGSLQTSVTSARTTALNSAKAAKDALAKEMEN